MTEVTDLSRYIAVCISTPLACFAAVILIREWRIKFYWILTILFSLITFFLGIGIGIYHLTGPALYSRYFMGTLPAFIYNLLFLLLVQYRDGRVIFSLVTVQMLHTMGISLCAIFAPYGSLLWVILLTIYTLIICFLLLCFFRLPFQQMLTSIKQGWLTMSAIPFSILSCLYSSCIIPMMTDGLRTSHRIGILLIFSAAIITYLGLYQSLAAMRHYYTSINDANLLKSQINALERQTAQIMAADEQNRIFRHDQRHYLQLLSASASANNMENINRLLENMKNSLDALDATVIFHSYSGNSLLDTVLSLAAWRAKKQETELDIQISLPPNWHIDITEFAIMVSNALENALNACQKIQQKQKRHIRLYTHTTTEQLFFVLSNTFETDPNLEYCYTSPKNFNDEHGYGVRSITAFVQRYHGIVEYSIDDNYFSLKLLL